MADSREASSAPAVAEVVEADGQASPVARHDAEGAPSVVLEELLVGPAKAPAIEGGPAGRELAGMRTARVARVRGRQAWITTRGRTDPVEATIAAEVDPDLVADAAAQGESVLVEHDEDGAPFVVAVLQTRRPRALHLKAATVTIEGDEELVLRSGRGAIRIRNDGDIEVIGSRISAASRGLFRIVGRMLRLN